MPTHSRAVEVKLPEAVLLADLYEIASDLESASRLCDKVIELGRLQPRDYFVEEGLVTGAVVKYGRCFTEGVRLSLKLEDLAALSADRAAAHEYFLALRHKFVAHAVNAFQETYVTATARVKDGVLQPISSVHRGEHRMLLTAETARYLLELIADVYALVKQRIAIEEEALLAHISSLPLEVVHAWDLHMPGEMKSHQVHSPRERGFHARNKRR